MTDAAQTLIETVAPADSVKGLRSSASAVFLACEPTVASDISARMSWAAGEIERLQDRVKGLLEANNAGVEERRRLEAALVRTSYALENWIDRCIAAEHRADALAEMAASLQGRS